MEHDQQAFAKQRTMTCPVRHVHGIEGTLREHEQVVKTRDVDIKEKSKKVPVVKVSHAVIHPWAVMI